MNCTTCRYELSQCLDGRLPSGRRATVMQHALQCEACHAFWQELQAAQRLTLRLQRPRVSEDFRESLWQRIQAGEGTPDAVFREPVPLLAKVRYALTGAAAAAAAVLCITWFGPHRDEPLTTAPVAKLEDRKPPQHVTPGPLPPTAMLAGNESMFPPAQRLGFNEVASEAARQFDDRYASATAAMARAEDGNSRALAEVFEEAREFRMLGDLLLDMRERRRLQFEDSDTEQELRFAVGKLAEGRRRSPSLEAMRDFVKPALQRNLSAMPRKILVKPLDPHEERDAVRYLKMTFPEVFPMLFEFVGFNDEPSHLLLPGSTFVLTDECGIGFGVPRSEAERTRRILLVR